MRLAPSLLITQADIELGMQRFDLAVADVLGAP